MAEKRDVTITVSAKNLTEAEFKKVRKALGGIGASAGKAGKKTSVLTRGFQSFGKAAPGALKVVAMAATATVGAIVGVTAAVIKLGERGAAVADVTSAFNALSEATGETGAVMISELAAGVKGTISNFDLMKVANKALGAGLLNSSKDARTMSEGARLLAKRTGTDTVTAFNTLTTAMASGRTAQLKQLGLFVDNKKAVEDFALATGKSVSEMTDADRAAALQTATMAALRTELAGFPPPLSDFGELIERGKVGVRNLVDQLSVMISESPVLLAGMHSVGDAIAKAFGSDKEAQALAITNVIEKAAFFVIEFGRAGIKAAQILTQGFGAIKLVVYGVASAIATVSAATASMAATVIETAATIPILGAAYEGAAVKARQIADQSEAVSFGLKQQVTEAALAAGGHDALGVTLTNTDMVLGQISQSMVNAGVSQRGLTAATEAGTGALGGANAAAVTFNANLTELPLVLTTLDGKIIETKDKVSLFGEETALRFGEMGQNVTDFGLVNIGMGDVVSAQTARMGAAYGFFGLKTKAELKKTAEEAEKHFEKMEESGKATAEELQIAWEKVEEARREAQGETESFTMTSNQAILTGSKMMLQELGTKNKAAAYASAIIGTAEAVVQALRSSPPPGSWILAGINAAMGAIQIATIARSQPYETGTAGLDFQNFGQRSLATLHGMEAVVPQGAGHMLGREVAKELGRMKGPTDGSLELVGELRDVFSELRDLPLAIQRSVRDGVLLAAN